jgi:hypothetical protein
LTVWLWVWKMWLCGTSEVLRLGAACSRKGFHHVDNDVGNRPSAGTVLVAGVQHLADWKRTMRPVLLVRVAPAVLF